MDEKKDGANDKQGGLSWSTPAQPTATPKPAAAPAPVRAPAAAAAGGARTGAYMGMLAVGILAGVVLAWGWSATRSSPSATSGTASTTATTGSTSLGVNVNSVPAVGADPSLSIMSPQPAGASVAVSKAIVSAPTWVVVYENKEGKPGNALGAALFFPEKQAGTVSLLRATVSGKSYLAVRQVDNGDRKFSLRGDPYLAEDGNVQWVTFEVR